MPWTAERTSVNQKLQFGAESTSALGTAVAAGKLLQNYDFTFGIIPDITNYRPTGRKYDSVLIENSEWSDGTMAGTLDYNTSIYPLASAMGSVAPVAHGSSATAKDWVFSPPVTGSVVPQTYTIQQGDAIRAQQFAYGLFTQFGYKGDRKSFSVSGKLLAQAITDGATLTSSPTAVALSPVAAKHVNIYLDSAYGSLGTTQLTRVLSIDYTMDNIYGPLLVLNRANLGYTAHVDMAPKASVKLKVEADANGMALLGYLQAGTTYFLRVAAVGAQIASDGPGAVNATFQHDMAIKIGKPSTFSDDQGVFAIEWECPIVEDSGWGHSQLVTVTNLLTAL